MKPAVWFFFSFSDINGGSVRALWRTLGVGVYEQGDRRRSCLTWLLELVGNDATHEVWMGAVQCGHQLVQLFLLWQKSEQSKG